MYIYILTFQLILNDVTINELILKFKKTTDAFEISIKKNKENLIIKNSVKGKKETKNLSRHSDFHVLNPLFNFNK